MPPRRPPSPPRRYHGVRFRSGRYAAEITCKGDRLWLGTFKTPELAARAYDAVAWMYGRSRSDLNFPEIPDARTAAFLAPRYRIYSRAEEKARRIREMDEAAMAAYAAANPHLLAEEIQFYANKEKKRRKEDEEIDQNISEQVDRDFEEMERDGVFDTSDDEEEVKSSTGN